MLRQLTSAQVTELEEMWAIEGGWGDYKQDYRIGQLTALFAEANRDRKKHPKPYSTEDFALRPKGPRKETKREATKRMRSALNMMAKGK
jgi:hypothetical protein